MLVQFFTIVHELCKFGFLIFMYPCKKSCFLKDLPSVNNMADQSQEQVQAQVALAMRGMAGITGRRKGNIIGAIAASGKYIL